MDKKKILVIDFDQSFLGFMTENLSKQGFQVLTATDGFSGFWKYKAEAPDLVLSEILLPKLHGFELCSRIHADTEKKTPVIFITGVQKDESYRKEAMETFGAVDYFDKPVNISAVLTVIRRVLGMRAIAEEAVAETAVPAAPTPETRSPEVETKAPEVETKGPEVEDRPITAPPVEKPAPGVPEKERPRKRTTDVTDIDALLKGTLDEIGYQRKERPTKTDMDKIPAPHATPPPAAEVRPPGKPPADRVVPPRKTDPSVVVKPRDTGTSEKIDVFDGYHQEKEKKGFPVIPVIGGVVVVAAALFFFVLNPGDKGPAEPASTAAALAAKAIAEQARINEETDMPELPPEDVVVETEETPPPVEPPPPPPAKPEPETARKPAPTPEPSAIMALPEASLAVDKPAAKAEPETPPEQEIAAPPAVKAGDIIAIQNVDVEPQLIKGTQPTYPESARRFRVEGTVTVNMLISETGEVIDVRTIRGIKGYPAFERAAESAVRKWRFRPAMKDGLAVKVWKIENFAFKI